MAKQRVRGLGWPWHVCATERTRLKLPNTFPVSQSSRCRNPFGVQPALWLTPKKKFDKNCQRSVSTLLIDSVSSVSQSVSQSVSESYSHSVSQSVGQSPAAVVVVVVAVAIVQSNSHGQQ
jgi:hypothetical protein